jgi:hypothetical protein
MILNLDYDNCSYDYIWSELFRLRVKYRVGLQVWQTSERSYHIRSIGYLPDELAWDIMAFSHCCDNYKEMCKRYGQMPFRISTKVVIEGNKPERVVPAPRLLFELP